MKNGILQFKIDGVVDERVSNDVVHSDKWRTAKIEVPRGSHELTWIYKKFNQVGASDDLSAEIDWIEIRGVKTINKACQFCERGRANAAKDRCEVCFRNEYLDESVKDGERCKKCPAEKYSPPGSVGADSCRPRLPCGEDDKGFVVSECEDGRRLQSFYWREPRICRPPGGAKEPVPVSMAD